MLLLKNRYIAGFVVLLTLASCGGGQQQAAVDPNAPVWVTDTVVTTSDAQFEDEYPGTLTSFNQVNLTPQVTGYITAIYFNDGQQVTKGQKLYRIDAEVYNANVSSAQANVAVQEAALIKAEQDVKRYHELDKNDAIAKQQVDYADAAYAAAKKQVAAARANVRSLSSNVRFTTISAPYSGTIGISQVRLGTAVFAGQTLLNTISTTSPIAVDFNIDQKDLFRFEQLRKTGSSLFSLAFDDGSNYGSKGHIALIDRSVDPQTGTIKVRLSFPNPSNALKPGMNATVKVPVGASARPLVIPYRAITEQLGEFFVYVIGDSSKVSQQRVQLGRQSGSSVVVLSGLQEGQHIVVDGTQKLKEGSKITLTPPAPPAAPGKTGATPGKK